MEKLLEEITYEGLKVSELNGKFLESDKTIRRQLDKLVEDGLVMKNKSTYRKVREIPSVGSIYDSMSMYHRQKLQDYQYRRKPRTTQLDITLQWYIESPNNIKGKITEYNEEQLLDNIDAAYTILNREFGVRINY